VPEVTDEDRAHFARVAAAKEAEREERLREALARHPVERMLEGLELGYAAKTDLEDEMRLDRRALGQAELAMRGRRLGRRVDE
jgi:hypothetical protein